ncbi:rho GTPase-activating protein 23-like isoform X2 [Mugil cephalus]|uniref:rho GTPase-activating protein 23-like isoform X2 n=1 Tax=Mugil cephalus TaxID=48193 RepID=UPI001FB5C0A0|nr:rho GTPase-activating protein 23-like isoform X2 [Mugil cephalus]
MAQAKALRDDMVSSSENRHQPLPSGGVEGVSWWGQRNIFLPKNSQGFGFTLRHFLIYPPASSLHSVKEEENGNATGKAGCKHSSLDPVDTIFVKGVKENGPAEQAGLRTGDRLVKVNGESILGKTYSQVITLIQNSDNILELSVVPKDEDVLQLVSVYCQDAYLNGNEPCTGAAHNLPEPPPLCYPSTKRSSHALRSNQNSQSPLNNWRCRLGTTTSPLDNFSSATSIPAFSWPGDLDNSSGHFATSERNRGPSSMATSALDFHFANHNTAIASATLPPSRKSSLLASARIHTDGPCHHPLPNWYYNQAEAAEHMSPRNRRISQDCLTKLGLGLELGPRSAASFMISAEQHRREALLSHHQAAAASYNSFWFGDCGDRSETGHRPCVESLEAAYAEYEENYGRSVKTLAQASALVSPCNEHTLRGSQMTEFSEQKVQKPSGGQHHQATIGSTFITSTVPLGERKSSQQIAEPQTRRVKEEDLKGYRVSSPSVCCRAGHLVQQTHSGRESVHGEHLSWSPGYRNSPVETDGGMLHQARSSPGLSAEERVWFSEGREVISPLTLNEEVVLTQKPPLDCQNPVQSRRHPHYTTPVELPQPPGFPGTPSRVMEGNGPKLRVNDSLAQQAFDSLSSIPFIGSVKDRRSSYLLAVTTERSKSCDEGLNHFKEEGHVFSKLPKRVKSFFTDGSLESLQAQDDTRSKCHSISDLGTITFRDVRKEGWLHYKQILTEKGKKVGGSMYPWKRAFAVLCSHLLFLYKDKRMAMLHAAGAGCSPDEHPPLSIRGCLIDIAYSESKRKHTLRLTTQNFCEYLLQAADRDDMLAWIKVIRESSNTGNEEIGLSRQALINKKLNDYRKHSLTGNKLESSSRANRMISPFLLAKTDNTSVNRASRSDDSKALWSINFIKKAKKTDSPKAFGVRLEDCQPGVNHKFVPLIVELCCDVVEATGLEHTGIYRVPGNNAMVSHLQEHLNKGMDINTAEERWQDLNVISSLLKSFFRKLPEPLFTDDKYIDFIFANRIEDPEDRLKAMKKLIQDLPDYYYHTLRFLVGHLKKVADHSERNKMEARNLALVFGPTLVRTSEDNMTDMVTHMPDRYKIVETLILHYDWFFSNTELDEEEKAPEDKPDRQPMPNIDHLLSNIGRPGMPGMPGAAAAETVDQVFRFHHHRFS